MSYPTYPEYEDSGVPWIGNKPRHWLVMKLHHMVRMKSGSSITSLEMDDDEAYPVFGGNGIRGRFSQYTHDGAYVLIGRQGAECGNVNYAYGKFWASEHAVVATPDRELEHHWLGETLRAMNLNQYSQAAAQPGLSVEVIGRLKLPYPPPPEQQQIAAFLDWKTGQIDALIARKKELLEKLKEKRIAVITQAVTKGLNPAAPMRDSGIPWLGQVPQHWQVKKFSYFSRVVRGASPRPAGDPTYFNGDHIPWITVGEITRDELIYLESTETMLTEEGAQNSRIMTAGTLVVTNSGATLGVPKILSITGCANDGVVAFEDLAENADKVFLYFFLRSQTEELRERMKQGGGQPNLNTDIIKALSVPFPPLDEQTRIAKHLRGETAKIDKMTDKVAEAIDRLTEYRTALITAATTGKTDVREVQIPAKKPD
jgi:type I restriction enzyme S subunit